MLGHLDATLRADEEALLAQKAPAFEGGGYGAYARRGDGGDAIDAPRTAHTLFVLNPRRAPLAAAYRSHQPDVGPSGTAERCTADAYDGPFFDASERESFVTHAHRGLGWSASRSRRLKRTK